MLCGGETEMDSETKRLHSASATHIFNALKLEIALGILHPKQRLIESELVEKFASHRPAVREALGMLAQVGLVVQTPHKGSAVAELTRDKLEKIYQMRIELECLAVAWMTLPLAEQQMTQIKKTFEAHAEALHDRHFKDIFRLNAQFHQQINQHCGNPHLEEMIEVMSARGLLARFSTAMTHEFLCDVERDHLEIVQAMEACDRQRLVSVMHRHNVRGRDWYAAAIEQREVQCN